MKKIDVFIVDDHHMVIEGIKSILQNCEDVDLIGYATNASSCLAFLNHRQPDVILMDISMPDKNGIELCQEVKSKFPVVNILGLSTFDQKAFVDKMMESGASGYVLKNVTKVELLKAIHEVNAGHKYLSFAASKAFKAAQLDKTNIPFATRREIEVLQLIAEGLTNNEIGEKLAISSGTVDKHRKSLLAKYEVKNTAALVRFATVNNLI